MTDGSPILLCPHCGSGRGGWNTPGDGRAFLSCLDCGARTANVSEFAEALALWNRRATAEAPVSESRTSGTA